jgi:hypothetical protein
MTRVDEFDAFYDGSRRHVLHLAYAFTGDLAAAVAATQDAYAHAWQHWGRLHRADPLDVVRPAALHLAGLRHHAHLVRRKPPADADGELITALGALSGAGRRLVLLHSIGRLDLSQAAREVGITGDLAVRDTDAAVQQLETSLGTGVDGVIRRLEAMHRLSDVAPMPRASIIRRTGGRRHRRNTAAAVAVCAVALVGVGVVVTAPAAETGKHQQRVMAEEPPAVPREPLGPRASLDQLLGTVNVGSLDTRTDWVETGASDDPTVKAPLTSCAGGRYASPRPEQGLARTFVGERRKDETVVQSVEVSGSKQAARAAFRTKERWYAGCQAPRVQLMQAYTAERDNASVSMLSMRVWSEPVRTMTVGVARSGFLTTTLVHEVDGRRGIDIGAFNTSLSIAVTRLCRTTRASCSHSQPPRPVPPPRTGEGSGFLGVVDLPPVADITKAWAGTEPGRVTPNSAATACEAAEFTGEDIELARGRTYVVPEAEQLPTTFGIDETIGRFTSRRAAAEFVRRVSRDVESCEEENLAAKVSDASLARAGEVLATRWKLLFDLNQNRSVTYRMGLVRNGSRVAQLRFSPTGRYDIDDATFEQLLLRAGQRLGELPDGAPGSAA